VTAGSGGTEGRVQVPSDTLDTAVGEALGDAATITLLKADVEGLETQVFASGQETLRRTEAVLVEVNVSALERHGTTRAEMLRTLEVAGLTQVTVVTRSLDAIRRRFAPTYEGLLVTR
jgi:hypothetical protein